MGPGGIKAMHSECSSLGFELARSPRAFCFGGDWRFSSSSSSRRRIQLQKLKSLLSNIYPTFLLGGFDTKVILLWWATWIETHAAITKNAWSFWYSSFLGCHKRQAMNSTLPNRYCLGGSPLGTRQWTQ